MIEPELGVRYHPHYLGRPLKTHGFSVQRPATRAKERDELMIAVWPKRDRVVVKRRPSGKAARSFFGTRRVTAPGHHLGAAWADLGAEAPQQAAGGVEHCGVHPGRAAVCPPCPHQRHEPDHDLSLAVLQAQNRDAAAGGLGSAQRPSITGHHRLHRGPEDVCVSDGQSFGRTSVTIARPSLG
ncbi:helix-turn-helix domain-containing protein [Microvirga terrae]|uniref:helix-turn-helix domain-containing protein n=1 Tax=Microvirga terrae TaxID=2740529 RepID=UPI003D814823